MSTLAFSQSPSRGTSTKPSSEVWDALVHKTVGLDLIKRHALVLHGLDTSLLETLVHSYVLLSKSEVLKAVGINDRTVQRRRGGLLSPEQSGATLDLIEVTQKAIEVLGDRAAAENWLHEPALAFDGRKPIALLCTRPGVDLVRDHLTRMEYGVYA